MDDWRIGDVNWMGFNNSGYNAKIYYKNKFVVLCIQTHPKAEKRFLWDNDGKKYRDELSILMKKNNKTLSEFVDMFLRQIEKPKVQYNIPEPTPIRVSTMTIVCQLKFRDDNEEEVYIDLRTLVQYLELDGRIVKAGTKETGNDIEDDNESIVSTSSKGKKKDKKSFYNQVTLLVNFITFNVNVKVFKNGHLQMTGCKSEENAIETANIVANALLKTKGDIVVDTVLSKDKMYVCEFDKVYSVLDYETGDAEPIGYYEIEQRNSKLRGQTRLYMLDKETEKYNPVFYTSEGHLVWETFTSDVYRKVYNTNGEHIGDQRIVFDDEYAEDYQDLDYVHKNNAIFSKDKRDRRVKFLLKDDMTVETRGKQKVGHIKSYIDDDNEYGDKDSEKQLVTWYETVRYSEGRGFEITNMKIGMINTDYVCGFEINRSNLNKVLVHNYNLESILKIEKYPGVNTKLYTNDTNNHNDGSFVCRCKEEKCGCSKVSVLTFKSGKIIITGAKKMSHIEAVYKKFNKILRTHFEDIAIHR